MITISADQFKKQYGDQAMQQFGSQSTQQPGYFQRVGTDLKNTATGLGSDLQTQADTIAQKELQPTTLGNIAETGLAFARGGLRTVGAAAHAAFAPIMEAPGIKQVSEAIGGALAKTTPMQKFQEWSQRHPQAAKDINNVLDVASLFGGKEATVPLAEGAVDIGKTIGEKTGEAVSSATAHLGEKTAALTKNVPESIMTKVARLNPMDEVKFTKVAGKSPGQYLVDTGNFGPPDQIIAKEAEKFTASKNSVDEALSTLPGEYQHKPVEDALKLLTKKGERVSSKNVPAAFSERAQQLLDKYQSGGLNMSEINEVKRLFERELKLGYSKALNPDLIQKATNIDSAIRKWQVEKADYLGFKNIRELNKQTQISKFLVDKLGNKLIGQSALNNMGLSDWIVLSGGNPTAIGGFLTKKFFSSKSVQARIAKMLNSKEAAGIIKPETFQPAGLLEKAKVINLPGRGILEGQAKLRE